MSIELLVVKETEQLVIVDRLSWGTTRHHSGILLKQTENGWSVGLPHLEAPEDPSDAYGIQHRRLAVHVPELKKLLRVRPFVNDEQTWSYHPPFGDPLELEGPVGWFEVTENGFELPNQ
jgi:hypothetical protein